MVAGGLGLALVAALAAGQKPLALAAEHARCVRSERITTLQDQLAGVDEDRRSAACADLLARRPAGAGLSADVALEDIARLTCELEGIVWTPLQAFADSLDLSLTPGAFEARDEGRGEPVTVRVHGLWAFERVPDFSLTLTWVSPDGERIVARSEPIEGGAIRGPGFEMYVRPPASSPGVWALEPCVERPAQRGGEGDVERAYGRSVRVACVDDLSGRFAAAVSGQPRPGEAAFPLLRMADRLVRYGARSSVTLDAGEVFALLDQESTAARPDLPVDPSHPDGAGPWVWSLRPAGELRRTVCVLTSSRSAVDEVFAGELGRRWSAFAHEHGAVLFASELPRTSASGGARGLLERIAAEGRARVGAETPFLVVARGETAGRLQLALQDGAAYPFDELVISAVLRTPNAAAILPGVPRLVVSPGAVADEAAGVSAASGAALALFNDLELPALVGAWLTR